MNTTSRLNAIDEKYKNSKSVSVKKEPEKRSTVIITWVVCFLLAFFLWIYVMETEKPLYQENVSGIDVTVALTNAQSHFFEIASIEGDVELTLKVEGDKVSLSKCNKDTIVAYADVSNITVAGIYECNVIIVLPDGVSLGEAETHTVTVVVEDVK